MTDDEVCELMLEVEEPIRGLVRRYFGEYDKVEDAMQEIHLAIWTARTRINPQDNPRSYVIGVAHQVLWAIYRRRFQPRHRVGECLGEVPLELVELTAPPDESTLQAVDIQRAFGQLPSHLWVVAWLVHGEGFLVSETAKRLGIDRALAEQRLGEATVKLRELLNEWR